MFNLIFLLLSVKNCNMMASQTSIGLMDSAYFVPKNQLLRWINQTLELDINYVQDLGSGSVYSQLIDAYYKNVVPMGKINWRAKFEYQFTSNLKIFQQSLEKIGVTKRIDIVRLSKAKYQDNLEILQWLKKYLQITSTKLEPYHARQRRSGQNFLSHHSQKNSYINRPGKQSLNSTMNISTAIKKQSSLADSRKNDKFDKIKKILSSNQIADKKLQLISNIVYGDIPKRALFERSNNCQQIQEQIQ